MKKLFSRLTKEQKSSLATALGLISSIVTALAVIDFDNWNCRKPSDIMKVVIIVLPILCGHFTTIKDKDDEKPL